MLVSFAVENFRSYRERKTLQLTASPGKELPQNTKRLPELDARLLLSAALYGANASGKSNLLKAMHCLSGIVSGPLRHGRPTSVTRFTMPTPFALDPSAVRIPTRFEIRFLVGRTLYEYALALSGERVDEERLDVYQPGGRKQNWLEKEGGKAVKLNRTFRELQKPVEQLAGQKIPAMAVFAAFEPPQLSEPAHWLARNLGVRGEFRDSSYTQSGLTVRGTHRTAELYHKSKRFRSWVDAFIRYADLGVTRVEVEVSQVKIHRLGNRPKPGKGDTTGELEEVKEEEYEPYFVHTGEGGSTARFPIDEESQGTKRLFWLLAPFYEVLEAGEVVIVDEFGTSLHPALARELIRVFHHPELNRNGAQLILATHDASLLSGQLFRRDQVWFTEKNPVGATDLYSLHDIKDVRPDDAFEKGYLRGRYGAIPFFGKFDFPQIQETSEEGEAKAEAAGAGHDE
jgi:energy-coupling factor transporter ATP-binding protein EcfA2